MASSLVQQMRGGGRTAQELKNSRAQALYERTMYQELKLDCDAISGRFFTLRRPLVLAFAGLNVTGSRANGVII